MTFYPLCLFSANLFVLSTLIRITIDPHVHFYTTPISSLHPIQETLNRSLTNDDKKDTNYRRSTSMHAVHPNQRRYHLSAHQHDANTGLPGVCNHDFECQWQHQLTPEAERPQLRKQKYIQ